MKKILVINGHPDKKSFCTKLAESYLQGAQKGGSDTALLNLFDLDFDPVLHKGYRKRQDLEPDLLAARSKIEGAEHLVFVYPIWWGSLPALLKGFIDRLFLPGFAYTRGTVLPKPLLKGKTAHLIITMDSPPLYHWFFSGGHKIMINSILGFCGIKTKRISQYSPIKNTAPLKLRKWIDQCREKGAKGI
ncbi:MAG: NAD(P)H-dependent oxidoreductase [Spirochaetales bacterium]|nr:NAD(P)H-dependent oxidoreductase [Spirochaetales bacterium]